MSALTSLLVRDRVVPVRTIEEALQRQVVSGGDVETILLEADALPEDVLAAYRAAVYGFDAATRDSVMRASRDLVRLVPKEVAERERIVPIAREGRTLVLAAAQPLSADADSQLGFLLGHDLAVRIVNEVRIAAALALHYGVEALPRLARLAERLSSRDPGTIATVAPPELSGMHNLPSKRRASAFDDDDEDDWDESEEGAKAAPLPQPEPEERKTRPHGFQIVEEGRTTMPGPAAKADRAPAPAPAAASAKTPTPAATKAATGDTGPARPQQGARPLGPPAEAPARAASATSTSSGRLRAPKLRGPITLEQGIDMLRATATRDDVLDVFFTFARQFFDYSALFVVGDDQAEGRESYGSGVSTQEITRVAIPLDAGLFADVRKDGVLRVGTLDKHAADRATAKKLGREPASTVAIVPLLIRSRVVLLLYGDRGGEPFGLHDVPELLAVLPRVSEAFERLIMQRKGKFGAGGASSRGDLKAAAQVVVPATKTSQRPPPGAFAKGGGQEGAIGKRLSAPPPAPAAPAAAKPAPAKPAEPTKPLAAKPAPTPKAAEPAPEPIDEPPKRDTLVDLPASGIAEAVAKAGSVVPARMRRVEGSPLQVLGVPRSAPPPPTPRRSPSGVMRAPEASKVPREALAETPPEPPPAPADADDDAPAGPRTEPAPPPPGASDDEPEMTVGEASNEDDGDDEPEMTVGESSGDDDFDVDEAPPEKPAQRGIGNYAMHIGSEERIGPTKFSAMKLDKKTPMETPRARVSRPPRDEPKVIVDMGETVEAVVVDLMRSPPDDHGTAQRLVRIGETALPVLVQSFPGPLWFDRHAPHKRLPRGRDVSAAARTLVLFGDKAVPYVSTLLSSRDADTRFYATLVAAEIPNAGLVPALGQRIFDDDQGTRTLVLDVLKMFARYAGIREVLDRVRAVARAPDRDSQTRRVAVRALGEMRDSRAVPLLVKLLDQSDAAIARDAHRGLVLLTRMDLGETGKKWETWLDRNEARHRIEWLIDALLADEEALRAAAGDELQRITQEYYGFHAGSPKKDRERVHKKYRDWWEGEGKKKFGAP